MKKCIQPTTMKQLKELKAIYSQHKHACNNNVNKKYLPQTLADEIQ